MSKDLMVTVTVPKARLDQWLQAEDLYPAALDCLTAKACVAQEYGLDADKVSGAALYEKVRSNRNLYWRSLVISLLGIPKDSDDAVILAAVAQRCKGGVA